MQLFGFNERLSCWKCKTALQIRKKIDIRYYSIIEKLQIDDLKDAMKVCWLPEMKEEVLGTAEIREIFKISKVGSIAVW